MATNMMKRCVSVGAHCIAQGEPVNPHNPGFTRDKTDLHGKMAVQIGETEIAVGTPIPSIRRAEK